MIVLRRFALRGRVKVFVVPRRMSRCTAAPRREPAQRGTERGLIPHKQRKRQRRIGLTRGGSVFARADEMLRASAHAIADAIRDGNLAAGTRLPSLQQIVVQHRVMPVDRASRTNK